MREKTLAYLYFGLRCFCIGTAIYGNGIDLESIHLAECLIALEISLLLRIRLTQRASSFGSLRSICHGGPPLVGVSYSYCQTWKYIPPFRGG